MRLYLRCCDLNYDIRSSSKCSFNLGKLSADDICGINMRAMKPYVPTDGIPLATLGESCVVANNRCLSISRIYSDGVVVGSCKSCFGRRPALMTSIRKHTAYS
jgi:hypothetical protein